MTKTKTKKKPSLLSTVLSRGTSIIKFATMALAAVEAIRRLRSAYLEMKAREAADAEKDANTTAADTNKDGADVTSSDAPTPKAAFFAKLMPHQEPRRPSPGGVTPDRKARKLGFRPLMRGNRMIGKA